MKTRWATLALVLSTSMATLTVAQPRPDDPHRDEHAPHERGPDRRAPPPRPVAHEDRHDERGAGPDHAFRRGGRLPPEYRNRQYVVDDWRAHHLSAPPRGSHWVQTGADYVLAAVATGVIAQILLSGQ